MAKQVRPVDRHAARLATLGKRNAAVDRARVPRTAVAIQPKAKTLPAVTAIETVEQTASLLLGRPAPAKHVAPEEPVVVARSVRVARVDDDPRPFLLHVSDVRDWAFDVNGRAMERYLPELRFEHAYVVERSLWPDLNRFDAVFLPYHRWRIPRILRHPRLIGSLRSEWFFPEEKGPIDADALALVDRYRGFYVNNGHVHAELSGHRPWVTQLTNPVDTQMFCPPTRIADGDAVACWTGNAKHCGDVKGFGSVVVPACERAGTVLKTAEYHTSRIPHAAMPEFFRGASVVLCASAYEGASNSLMEAMATGLAVVTTAVGNVSELVASQWDHLGDTGIMVVDRHPDAFASALRWLQAHPARVTEMGALNALEIQARWSWDAWRERYLAFFTAALER